MVNHRDINIFEKQIHRVVNKYNLMVENISNSTVSSILIFASRQFKHIAILGMILMSVIAGLSFQGYINLNTSITVALLVLSYIVGYFGLKYKYVRYYKDESSIEYKVYRPYLLFLMSLPAVAMVLVAIYQPLELFVILYAVLFGVLYYMFGSIERNNGKITTERLYNELAPHKDVLNRSVIGVLLITVLVVLASQAPTDRWLVLTIFATALSSMAVQYSLRQNYQIYCEWAGLKMRSPVWLLTPYLIIILALGFSLVRLEWYYLSLMYAPPVTGVIFWYYITSNAGTNPYLPSDTVIDVLAKSNPYGISTPKTTVDVDEKNDGDTVGVRIGFEHGEVLPNPNEDSDNLAINVDYIADSLKQIHSRIECDSSEFTQYYQIIRDDENIEDNPDVQSIDNCKIDVAEADAEQRHLDIRFEYSINESNYESVLPITHTVYNIVKYHMDKKQHLDEVDTLERLLDKHIDGYIKNRDIETILDNSYIRDNNRLYDKVVSRMSKSGDYTTNEISLLTKIYYQSNKKEAEEYSNLVQ